MRTGTSIKNARGELDRLREPGSSARSINREHNFGTGASRKRPSANFRAAVNPASFSSRTTLSDRLNLLKVRDANMAKRNGTIYRSAALTSFRRLRGPRAERCRRVRKKHPTHHHLRRRAARSRILLLARPASYASRLRSESDARHDVCAGARARARRDALEIRPGDRDSRDAPDERTNERTHGQTD